MAKKKIIIIGSIILIMLLVAFVLFGGKTSAPTTDGTTDTSKSQEDAGSSETQSSATIFTAADVAKHSTATDCWTIIEGGVYNITSYVPRHPGGDEILQACGKDGTSLFTQRTTSDGQAVGSGTPHSSAATSRLSTYKLGTVN